MFYIFNLFDFLGYAFTLNDAVLLVIYGYVLFQFIIKKRNFRYFDKNIFYILTGFLLSYVFSIIGILQWGGNESIFQYFKTLSHFAFVIFYAYVTLSVEIELNAFFYAIRTLLYFSIFVNIYAIYQLFARIFGLPFAYIDINNVSFLSRDYGREIGEMNQIVLAFENFYRATSIFSEPSGLALFNIWMLIFLLIPYFSKTRSFIEKNSLRILIGVLSSIGLLLTFSLSGLSLITLVLLIVIITEKFSIKQFILPISITIIIIFSADLFLKDYTKISILDLFSQRVTGLIGGDKAGSGMTTGESAPKRINSMVNALNLFEESPIVGIGVGNTYNHPLSTERFADSSFFQVLSETGIIGTFFYILIFVHSFRISLLLRKYRYKFSEKFPKVSTMQSLALPWIIMLAFHNLFLGNFVGSTSFWMSLGYIFATYHSTMRLLPEISNINKN